MFKILNYLLLLFLLTVGVHGTVHAAQGYPFRASVTQKSYDSQGAVTATQSASILVDSNRYKLFSFDINAGASKYIQVEDRHYVIDTENNAVYRGFMGINFEPTQANNTYQDGEVFIKREYQHQSVDGKVIVSGWKEYRNNTLASELVFENFRLNSVISSADFKVVQEQEDAVAEKKEAYNRELAAYTADYYRRQAEANRNWRPDNSRSSGIGIQSVGPPSLPYAPPQAPNYLNFQGSIQTQPGNGIAYTAAPYSFSQGDITLTQAAVNFTETDLELPGKNGLNLKISRTYNSRNYQSTTKDNLYKGQWGGGLGHGWHLGTAKRAYVVNFVGNELGSDIITIENGGGSLEFYYGKDHGEYSSQVPGNFNKAYRINGGLKLVTTAGITMVYKEYFYFDRQNLQYHDDAGYNWPQERWLTRFADTTGYYLSYIEDQFGNKITYEYETFAGDIVNVGAKHSVFEGLHSATNFSKLYVYGNRLSRISNYMHEITREAEFYHFDSTLKRKRLKTITDTFNRKVNIGYDDTWNLSPRNENYYSKVSSIKYTDTLGQTQQIKYKIDTSGRLEAVQHGNLPEKKYDYTWFDSEVKHIEQYNQPRGHISRIFGVGTLHSREFDFKSHYHSNNKIIRTHNYTKYDGSVLKSIKHATGSETQYKYTPQLQHGLEYDPGRDEQRVTADNDNIAFAAPAVIRKKVYESANSRPLVYNYYYQNQNNKIRNKSTAYFTNGSWSKTHASFFYANAKIDNPDVIQDEEFWFTAGVIKRKKSGDREEIHDYDFLSNPIGDGEVRKKTKETYKLAGTIQSQVVYNTHDNYLNPTQITRYNGTTPHSREDIVYDTASNLINRNLVSIVKSKTTTSLVDNTQTSIENTYHTNTKLKATYDTTGGKRTLLKEYTYDSAGRILTEVQNGVGGKLTAYYSYTISGGQYKINKRRNNKTKFTIYELNTGLPIETSDENGQVTRTQYDNYGRPTRITYPDGNVETQSYSGLLI